MSGRQQAVKLAPGVHGLPRQEVDRIQRQRLFDAMAEVVAEVGYEESTVELVLNNAGVSRRTFYELFSDREDCFVAAYDAAMRDAYEVVVDVHEVIYGPIDRRDVARLPELAGEIVSSQIAPLVEA